MNATSHWASIQEAGAISGMRFMFTVYRWLGRLPFRICLFPVILYFFLCRHTARHASLQYLRYLQQSGRRAHSGALLWQSYLHFLSFGESLLDKLAVWQGDIDLDDVSFHNYEAFSQLADAGRGGLIIGSHLGNLEICRALVYLRRSHKINVLMHTAHAQKFNQMLQQAGSSSHVNIIQVTDINPATAILLQQKISAGEFLVIAGDRTPVSSGKNTCRVKFLGREARLPLGPYLLAAILKCPVLSVFCLRREGTSRPHFDFYLDTFAERIQLSRGDRHTALQGYCQQYADLLANYCARAPLQWYNFHNFWGDSDPEPPAM